MIITDHAYEKAKERLGLKKRSFDKMALEALEKGKTHSECKGSLKRYVTKLWFQYKICNNIRFHNQNIFFFVEDKLITVYQCPKKYHNHLKI